MYIAPGRCRQHTEDKFLMTIEMPLKKKSDFIHIFNDFIYVYSCRARADNPLGTNFWCQQKALITLPICRRFKKNCFEVWFYIHFFSFFHHMYNPLETKFWWQEKGLFSLPICCKFQNDLFEIWFYTHFLIILYMNIAPGQGQTNP